MSILLRLFLVFLKIGLFSIGGGYAIIPLIREQVVREYEWINAQTFTDIITISQMTPGPLAVNTSTFVGLQIAGLPGAILATLGCVLGGILIALALYRFFQKKQNSIYIFEILKGLKAASLGLIVSAAATMIINALWGVESLNPDLLSAAFNIKAAALFIISLMVLRKWKLNPILIIAVGGLAGILMYL